MNSIMFKTIACAWLAILSAMIGGCASSAKQNQKIRQMVTSDFRVRRPTYKPADPTLGPGGQGYTSEPSLPGKNFDCIKPAEMLKDLDLRKIYECVSDGLIGVRLVYKLVYEVRPLWKLQIEETTEVPECVIKTLSEIPVPREIFYFAPHQENASELTCTNSRLPIEADEIFSQKFSDYLARKELRVDFPLEEEIKTVQDVERTLLAWGLTPFYWDDGSRYGLKGKIVPDSICRECFGKLPADLTHPNYP